MCSVGMGMKSGLQVNLNKLIRAHALMMFNVFCRPPFWNPQRLPFWNPHRLPWNHRQMCPQRLRLVCKRKRPISGWHWSMRL